MLSPSEKNPNTTRQETSKNIQSRSCPFVWPLPVITTVKTIGIGKWCWVCWTRTMRNIGLSSSMTPLATGPWRKQNSLWRKWGFLKIGSSTSRIFRENSTLTTSCMLPTPTAKSMKYKCSSMAKMPWSAIKFSATSTQSTKQILIYGSATLPPSPIVTAMVRQKKSTTSCYLQMGRDLSVVTWARPSRGMSASWGKFPWATISLIMENGSTSFSTMHCNMPSTSWQETKEFRICLKFCIYGQAMMTPQRNKPKSTVRVRWLKLAHIKLSLLWPTSTLLSFDLKHRK